MKFHRFAAFILFFSALISVGPALAANDQTQQNTEESTLPLKDLQRFATAVQAIKTYYVEPISDDKLFENAIRGMAEGLDPHSTYLDAEDFKDLQDATSGEFSGLGLEVMLEDGLIRVVSPIDDTPAQKAGIKPGDLIVRINNEPVKGMLLRDAIRKMRGKAGTSINLTLFRKNETKPLKIKLIRQNIKVQSVKSQMLGKGFGYIRISTFQANTGADLLKEIKQLKQKSDGHLKGLVLDLRNNPGGLLDSAVEVTNDFLESKKLGKNNLIVYTKGRLPAAQYTARANGKDILEGAPMVALINEGSASGAEIVAGALQDDKRALIIGTNSFGKGSVQTVLPLDNDSALKLTTALYYTPLGRSIQAKGIRPDITVEEIEWPGKKEAKNDDMLKEADLLGHLSNNASSWDTQVTDLKTDTNEPPSLFALPSPRTDYQLNQALILLKGLIAAKN